MREIGPLKCGEVGMAILMNLIWRRLAYTLLAGMRAKLVRQ